MRDYIDAFWAGMCEPSTVPTWAVVASLVGALVVAGYILFDFGKDAHARVTGNDVVALTLYGVNRDYPRVVRISSDKWAIRTSSTNSRPLVRIAQHNTSTIALAAADNPNVIVAKFNLITTTPKTMRLYDCPGCAIADAPMDFNLWQAITSDTATAKEPQ